MRIESWDDPASRRGDTSRVEKERMEMRRMFTFCGMPGICIMQCNKAAAIRDFGIDCLDFLKLFQTLDSRKYAAIWLN